MATIGTTTATAILPPCDRPADGPSVLASFVGNGAAAEEDSDRVEDEGSVGPEEG